MLLYRGVQLGKVHAAITQPLLIHVSAVGSGADLLSVLVGSAEENHLSAQPPQKQALHAGATCRADDTCKSERDQVRHRPGRWLHRYINSQPMCSVSKELLSVVWVDLI